jgi:Phage integrase family.
LVEWQGKRTYLGVYGTPESRETYRRFCARLRQPIDDEVQLEITPGECTVAQLVSAYLDWAQVYYADGAEKPKEYQSLVAACRPLLKKAGAELVDLFRPSHLRAVRKEMVDHGWARLYVNRQVHRLGRVFRWGVERDLVDPSTLARLKTLQPLRKGKTTAPETPPVRPVNLADVERVAAELPPVLAAMVWLQRWTGMRSESLVVLRPCDLERSGATWRYRPAQHKTAWRDHELTIHLGPQAQAVLEPLLAGRNPEAYLFSPVDVVDWRQARKRAARKSKVQPSQVDRRKPHAAVRPGKRFTINSYRRAITNAAAAINAREQARVDELLEQTGQRVEPQLVEAFTPHRLRHTRGTEVRARYGLEAAQVVLGHRHAKVTEIYAERNAGLAREIAAASG